MTEKMTEKKGNLFVQQAKAKLQKPKPFDSNKLLQDNEEGDGQNTQSLTGTSQSTQDTNWIDDEDKGGLIFNQEMIQPTKAPKKKAPPKAEFKTWGESVQNKGNEEEPAPVQVEPTQEFKDVKPKKIMKLPGQSNPERKKAGTDLNLEQEYFPGLGEEPVKRPEKVNRTPEKPAAGSFDRTSDKKFESGGAPPRFVNAKKIERPEPTGDQQVIQQVVQQVVQQVSQPTPVASTTVFTRGETASTTVFTRGETASTTVFTRGETASTTVFTRGETASTTVFTRGEARTETRAEEDKPEDSKIKFASDKPKFVSAKGSDTKKKETTKTEAELLREQKDKEIEDKLLKEKEEAGKRWEERGPKKMRKEGEGVEPEKEAKTVEPVKEGSSQPETENKFERKFGFQNAKKKDKVEGEWEEVKDVREQHKEHKEQKEHKEHREHREHKEIKDTKGGNDDSTVTRLVRKNPNPKPKHEENGETSEKQFRRPKVEGQHTEAPAQNHADEKKEETKIVPAHEVIAVTSNVTVAPWDIGLKKVGKKKVLE